MQLQLTEFCSMYQCTSFTGNVKKIAVGGACALKTAREHVAMRHD